ncbi:MAG: HD domain-containing phosphohydrolase [Candidatus Omnitrophota bacterium]
MVKKIITFIMINVIFFSALTYLCAQEFNCKPSCLSPQLQLQTLGMVSTCQAMYQHVSLMPQPGISGQENPEYGSFMRKLTKQVGSADDLMRGIQSEYGYKYGKAIERLEAKEAQRPADYEWVIKHEKEVMLIAYCLGKVLGFRQEQLAQIAIGCRFHDIGKCDTDPKVISDDRVFSDITLFSKEQQESIRNEIVEHSAKSYDILKECGISDQLILSVAFYHHANTDGTGYPDPVTRQDIPLEAKIARVADSFSAMLGIRPYNQQLKHSFASAVADIQNNSYVLYGPRVVQSFLSLVKGGEVVNRYEQLYHIPLRESRIFHSLYKQAQNIPYRYPFAKVSCGISCSWNQEPFCSATNTIGVHRHAEINLVLKVLDQELRVKNPQSRYLPELMRLEFLAYTSKINKSKEAMALLKKLTALAGEPFKNTVIYVTLHPCKACLEVFKELGIKEVYYGSEHPNQNFVQYSETAANGTNGEKIKVNRAYYVSEGVIEPNSLFFALYLKPGYENLAATIDAWFAAMVNHNDMEKMPIAVMQKKQERFQEMLNTLLEGINKDSSLDQIEAFLLATKGKLVAPEELSLFSCQAAMITYLAASKHVQAIPVQGIDLSYVSFEKTIFIEQAI